MTAGNIICMIAFIIVALIMLGIGISNIRSKSPVGFYSGEKPPKAEEVSDVAQWNKKHGMMWIGYSIIIMITYAAMFLVGDSIYVLIPCFTGLIMPIVVMIMCHHRLIKKYRK